MSLHDCYVPLVNRPLDSFEAEEAGEEEEKKTQQFHNCCHFHSTAHFDTQNTFLDHITFCRGFARHMSIVSEEKKIKQVIKKNCMNFGMTRKKK